MNEKTIQHVPIAPIGCFLDYTYCASPNCENKCGRKMSKEIQEAIDSHKYQFSMITYADFCGG